MVRGGRGSRRGPRRGVGCQALWAAFALSAAALAPARALAGEDAAPPRVRLRRLRGQERRAASDSRDLADQLRADYHRAYRGRHPKKEGEAAAFREAEAAYKEVLKKYPGTEIAGYCHLRLSGLYKLRRDYKAAEALIKQMARLYAGTSYEIEAYFSLGLTELQARHDPAAAIPWLEKVLPLAAEENARRKPDLSKTQQLHFSAQQQLIKCEVRLGRPAKADERRETLTTVYPQYERQINSHFRFELKSALSSRALAKIHPVLRQWMKENPQ